MHLTGYFIFRTKSLFHLLSQLYRSHISFFRLFAVAILGKMRAFTLKNYCYGTKYRHMQRYTSTTQYNPITSLAAEKVELFRKPIHLFANIVRFGRCVCVCALWRMCVYWFANVVVVAIYFFYHHLLILWFECNHVEKWANSVIIALDFTIVNGTKIATNKRSIEFSYQRA